MPFRAQPLESSRTAVPIRAHVRRAAPVPAKPLSEQVFESAISE